MGYRRAASVFEKGTWVVAPGEVASDVCRASSSPVELPFVSRPGGVPANVGRGRRAARLARGVRWERRAVSFLAATLVHPDAVGEDAWGEEAVREATLRGCAAGALACTHYGAMRALLTAEELEHFMGERSGR